MIGALHAPRRGRRCDRCSSQLLVCVDATSLHTPPDLSALCGEPELAGIRDEIEVLLNPSVLVEVRSPSTEAYDRGEKLWHYRQLASLRAYVLVSQDRMHVELFERAGANARWMFSDAYGPDGEAALPSIGATLAPRWRCATGTSAWTSRRRAPGAPCASPTPPTRPDAPRAPYRAPYRAPALVARVQSTITSHRDVGPTNCGGTCPPVRYTSTASTSLGRRRRSMSSLPRSNGFPST
jgi:hypothetical protein